MHSGEKSRKMALAGLTSSSDKLSKLFLWHCILGHPLFGKMIRSIPSLFIRINESFLYCETYFLAKSHRISYPSGFFY